VERATCWSVQEVFNAIRPTNLLRAGKSLNGLLRGSVFCRELSSEFGFGSYRSSI